MTHELLARLHVIGYHDHVVSTLGKTVIVPLIYPNIYTLFYSIAHVGKNALPTSSKFAGNTAREEGFQNPQFVIMGFEATVL